jgi:maleylpyruvate isomerase
VELYSYFRSTAAYRVRIALNLKGLPYDYVPVNLLRGEQRAKHYLSRNPQGLVPALALDDGTLIPQSLAILEWLEETHPSPALLPKNPVQRARVRSLADNIACDIHPLNNIAILNYLKGELSAKEDQISAWYATWVRRGFDAIERTLADSAGDCCFGDAPTVADCCLIPQVFNADRFDVPTEDYPIIRRVSDHCLSLDAFARAAPAAQPDAPT